MSDAVERARRALDNGSIGYVHPDGNQGRRDPYKTFNPTSSSDDPYASVSAPRPSPYGSINLADASLGADQSKTRVETPIIAVPKDVNPTAKPVCPVCGLIPAMRCECPLQDFVCKKGHVWYIKDSLLIIQDPHGE